MKRPGKRNVEAKLCNARDGSDASNVKDCSKLLEQRHSLRRTRDRGLARMQQIFQILDRSSTWPEELPDQHNTPCV